MATSDPELKISKQLARSCWKKRHFQGQLDAALKKQSREKDKYLGRF